MMKTHKGIIGLHSIRKPIRVLKSALGESPFSGLISGDERDDYPLPCEAGGRSIKTRILAEG